MMRPVSCSKTLRCSLLIFSATCATVGCGSEADEYQPPPAFSSDLLLPPATSPAPLNEPQTMVQSQQGPSSEVSPVGAEPEPTSTPQISEESTPAIEGNISDSPAAEDQGNNSPAQQDALPDNSQEVTTDEELPISEQPSTEAEPQGNTPPLENEQPVVDEPVAEEPINEEPVVEEPAVEEPVPPAPGDIGSIFFSDSFEGTRRPEWEESLNGGGTFSLDATQGANGTGSSMRVDATGFHTMLQYPLPDSIIASNQYFGRVHIRLEQAPQGHVTWIETGIRTQEFGRGNDEFEVRIGYNLGVLDLNRFPSDAEIRDPNTTISPNQWHCVQFFFDGNPEEARVWFDGEETALSTTDFTRQREGAVDNNQQPVTGWIPPLEAIRFGWELNGNTIWIDEVALSTEFVDCQ